MIPKEHFSKKEPITNLWCRFPVLRSTKVFELQWNRSIKWYEIEIFKPSTTNVYSSAALE